jgi:plasmid stability protein
MDLVIRDVPAKLLEKLDRKAKASGRSVEAEAAAIVSASLEHEEEADPAETFLKLVDGFYGEKRPQNVVDEFLAERRKLWGEEDR